MGYLKQKIAGHDLFGHPINLAFNKKGHTHNTVTGGFISILIKGFLLWFFLDETRIMFMRDNDKVSTAESSGYIDLKQLGEVNLAN